MKIYTESDIRRFYRFVAVGKPDECWEWIGATYGGYGTFWFGKRINAHRFAFYIATGHDPGSLLCCHHCDNKLCVNPEHLFLGTHADNAYDSAKKGRQFKMLSKGDADEIRTRYATGKFTQQRLADEYMVCQGTICDVVNYLTHNY